MGKRKYDTIKQVKNNMDKSHLRKIGRESKELSLIGLRNLSRLRREDLIVMILEREKRVMEIKEEYLSLKRSVRIQEFRNHNEEQLLERISDLELINKNLREALKKIVMKQSIE
jgi:hypothetical protein